MGAAQWKAKLSHESLCGCGRQPTHSCGGDSLLWTWSRQVRQEAEESVRLESDGCPGYLPVQNTSSCLWPSPKFVKTVFLKIKQMPQNTKQNVWGSKASKVYQGPQVDNPLPLLLPQEEARQTARLHPHFALRRKHLLTWGGPPQAAFCSEIWSPGISKHWPKRPRWTKALTLQERDN